MFEENDRSDTIATMLRICALTNIIEIAAKLEGLADNIGRYATGEKDRRIADTTRALASKVRDLRYDLS